MTVRFRAAHDQIALFERAQLPDGVARACFNESHLPPIDGLADAIAAEIPHLNEYGGRTDAALAHIARAHGRTADEVILGSGSMDVIRTLIGSVCEAGDEVVTSWRTFEGYLAACHAHGATPVTVPTDADGAHDVDALLAAITERTRILLLANPNTPSGRPLTREQLDRLIAETPDRVVLALDEAFSEFATSPRAAFGAPLFTGGGTDLPENVVVLRTLSKGAGLAGLRVGYALAAPAVIAGLSKSRAQLGVDRLAVAAVEHCFSREGLDQIEDRVMWIAAERQRIERTLRDRMERAEIDGRPRIDIVHSDGSFVWLPVGDRAEALRDHLVDAARVLPRAYAGEGVRYTVIEAEHNDRFIDGVSEWATRR
ncbi:aminotransferase class I/II-fold pyridoxal phosphate-dependent enzyme [Microbacterium karelineae]|uniref:aminotransferase class I/II-fold pyridoxal phosphate-dependent enzyme n=1 Tax=Microbacterium karelineae TaxID=2654283 RepID=UPI0012EAA626|nr:aminotransferase class I/II-fold pyridoxal phosphate-dependent enzyme [Microbacterium karelineae]